MAEINCNHEMEKTICHGGSGHSLWSHRSIRMLWTWSLLWRANNQSHRTCWDLRLPSLVPGQSWCKLQVVHLLREQCLSSLWWLPQHWLRMAWLLQWRKRLPERLARWNKGTHTIVLQHCIVGEDVYLYVPMKKKLSLCYAAKVVSYTRFVRIQTVTSCGWRLRYFGDYLDGAELLSLGSDLSCILPSILLGGRMQPFASRLGGEIAVCSGFEYNGIDCRAYDPEVNLWKETAPLPDARYGAGGIILSGSAWWITGSTELRLTKREASYYTDLPDSFSYHRFLKINDTHALLTGGQASTQPVYFVWYREKTMIFSSSYSKREL